MGIPQRFINSTRPVYCGLSPYSFWGPGVHMCEDSPPLETKQKKTTNFFPRQNTRNNLHAFSIHFLPFVCAKFNTYIFANFSNPPSQTHTLALSGGKFIIDARHTFIDVLYAFHTSKNRPLAEEDIFTTFCSLSFGTVAMTDCVGPFFFATLFTLTPTLSG